MVNHPNRRRKAAGSAAVVDDGALAWADLIAGVQTTFETAIRDGGLLFATDATGLYDLYLKKLPGDRQVHTCWHCRKFIENFGGLVWITDGGEAISALWDHTPRFYAEAVLAMGKRAAKASVTSPFLNRESVWGTYATGDWTHFCVHHAPQHKDKLLTAGQAMAAKREDFGTVARALADFTVPMLDEALRLLRAETLSNSERFIGPVQWLRTLQDRPKGRAGENVLWRAIASAPDGYCHPRASVIGSLLEDIAAGKSFAEIKRAFDAKLHPLMYQRPQAAPTVGNIKAAEAIIEKLGLAPSLERRFARLDEVLPAAIWKPKPAAVPPNAGGVFGHLKTKGDAAVLPVDMPTVTMTWAKFLASVLPTAEAMEFHTPMQGGFLALTTAVNPEAPPLLKWDRDDERNPVAWYVYPGGSPARQWGIAPGWVGVTAVVPLPTMWGTRPSPFLGEGVVLVLDGAMDSRTGSGNALFPACLKDDLHQVRATIEAYSRGAELSGRDVAGACGYDLRKQDGGCSGTVRVRVGNAWTAYHIDRWD